LSINTCIKD